MKMIMIPATVRVSPCVMMEKDTISSDDDTASTGVSRSISSEADCNITNKDEAPPRRSIFNTFWEKNNSSLMKEDDEDDISSCDRSPVRDTTRRFAQAKVQPSYMGVYSFSPQSPSIISQKPPVCPTSSDTLLTTPPSSSPRPKSILRRHRSLQKCRMSSPEDSSESLPSIGRPRSVSSIGPDTTPRTQLDIDPPPFNDDDSLSKTSSTSNNDRVSFSSDLKRHSSFVHFDPNITVRESVREEEEEEDRHINDAQESNWFTEEELRNFMRETINVCHSSAVKAINTYSLPAVKKAYDTAQQAGIKSPVLSSTSEYRALFADPALQSTDEDTIVNFGSKKFFKILAQEMQRVLIVDSSPMTLKLFRRQVLCIFPHVHIDTALSGEEALDKVGRLDSGLNYDLIIVEEHLQHEDSAESLDLTGSELLRLLNEMETCVNNDKQKVEQSKPSSKMPVSRTSLKIGVSVSLGEDCESLRKGGVDLFWSKPPPKPSDALRNQVMNALLNKRGKSVFICGC